MKTKKIMMLLLALIFATFTYAQNGPKWEGRGFMGRLNLTDEQKSKVENLRLELQKKQVTIRSKIQTSRIELKQILNADKLDKSAIEKKLNEISKLEIEQKMNFINHWEQVNQILTPEQQKIWKNSLRLFDSPFKKNMMQKGLRDKRGLRGPGKPQGIIEEFEMQNNDLASLLGQNYDFFDQDQPLPPFDEINEFDEELPPPFEEL